MIVAEVVFEVGVDVQQTMQSIRYQAETHERIHSIPPRVLLQQIGCHGRPDQRYDCVARLRDLPESLCGVSSTYFEHSVVVAGQEAGELDVVIAEVVLLPLAFVL